MRRHERAKRVLLGPYPRRPARSFGNAALLTDWHGDRRHSISAWMKVQIFTLPRSNATYVNNSPQPGASDIMNIDLLGKTSIADAIVFAVYIPPQAPAPGHAWRTISFRLFSSMRPARYSP